MQQNITGEGDTLRKLSLLYTGKNMENIDYSLKKQTNKKTTQAQGSSSVFQ